MEAQNSLFQTWIHQETLLTVEMLVRKVGRKTVFGRLLSVDIKGQNALLYDVDQKKVLSLKTNEIDKMTPADFCEY